MGGIGKSVLAAAFAYSYFTRRHLKYIYWLEGRNASHEEILERLARLIGVPGATADRLKKDLHGQAVGVIIDDAGRRHAEAVLDVLDRAGRVLVTTRDASEIAHSGMNFSPVDLLSEAESLDLLASWVGEGVREEPFA
jgi:NADPH:quinone reductase-like Zn-dependent oxidoreductase